MNNRFSHETLETGETRRQLSIVAHPDDDLLFMNPDILAGIKARQATCTVYVTSLYLPQVANYWQRREEGVRQAYAYMANVRHLWLTERVDLGSASLEFASLVDAPHVSLSFLRFPDHAMGDEGATTLRDLYEGQSNLQVTAVDHQLSCTRAELITLLTAIMRYFRPSDIRIQNPYATLDNDSGNGPTTSTPPYPDHPDHIRTAKLAESARQDYFAPHEVYRYRDYDIQNDRPNLSPSEAEEKLLIFDIYATNDSLIGDKCMGSPLCAPMEQFIPWTKRQYFARPD